MQRVAEDHLAGRRREIDAELERARVGLANAQVAVAGLDVLGQHFEAAHEILAALGERRAQQLRIGGDEVRGRQRGGDLAQIELRLVALVRLEFVGAPDQIVRPARRQHVGLLDEVEVRIVAPLGVGEALVRGVGRGDRRRLLALQALQRRGPEIDELRRQRRLRRERPLGLGHVIFGDPADRSHHLADVVGDRGLDLAALARPQIGGQHLAALLDRLRDVVGERFDVGRRILGARAGRVWRRGPEAPQARPAAAAGVVGLRGAARGSWRDRAGRRAARRIELAPAERARFGFRVACRRSRPPRRAAPCLSRRGGGAAGFRRCGFAASRPPA